MCGVARGEARGDRLEGPATRPGGDDRRFSIDHSRFTTVVRVTEIVIHVMAPKRAQLWDVLWNKGVFTGSGVCRSILRADKVLARPRRKTARSSRGWPEPTSVSSARAR